MKTYIFGSYLVTGGALLLINKGDYQPKNYLNQGMTDLLKWDTEDGKNLDMVLFGAAPLILPVLFVVVPSVHLVDYYHSFLRNKQ